MARTRIKLDRKALQQEVVREIGKVTDNEDLKRDIGIFATGRIRLQARTGKPLNDTGDFPSLRDATKKQREYLEQFNSTDPAYKKDRSNLTFTGQLLNSLGFFSVKDGIQLFYRDKRKVYKTGPSSRQRKVPTNGELALFLQTLGYFIFTKEGLEEDQKFNRQITQIVRRFIRRKLR